MILVPFFTKAEVRQIANTAKGLKDVTVFLNLLSEDAIENFIHCNTPTDFPYVLPHVNDSMIRSFIYHSVNKVFNKTLYIIHKNELNIVINHL